MKTIKGLWAVPGRILLLLTMCALLLIACSNEAEIRENPVRLAVSSDLNESGILDVLISEFTRRTGWVVEVTALDIESAVALGKQGLVDVLLINSPEAEMGFIEENHGYGRMSVMSLVFEDAALINRFSILIVDPGKGEEINSIGAEDLKEWITGRKAQSMIGNYKVNDSGGCYFIPNAPRPSRAPI